MRFVRYDAQFCLV